MCIFMAKYIVNGSVNVDTLVGKVISSGHSPISIFIDCKFSPTSCNGKKEGMVDSLQYLIHYDQCNVIGNREHRLASLLVKSF